MRKILCMLITAALLAGMLTGCGTEESDLYLDRVYPPHYQRFYEELMGKDLPEVAHAFGYAVEDFTYEEFERMSYIHNTPVEYLGLSLYPGFMFYKFEEGKELGALSYHTYLKEAPEEMAAKVESMAETLQKMFGYHFNGPAYKDPDERENGYREFDPQELAKQYAGDAQTGIGMIWILTDDVLHLPRATEEKCMCMEFSAIYNPEDGTVRVGVDFQLRQRASNLFVRIDE